jgi:hypothetical protein
MKASSRKLIARLKLSTGNYTVVMAKLLSGASKVVSICKPHIPQTSPKPGETKPKQRDLSLKLKAIVTNLWLALEKSIAIITDLALERFSWSDFLPTAIEIALRGSSRHAQGAIITAKFDNCSENDGKGLDAPLTIWRKPPNTREH